MSRKSIIIQIHKELVKGEMQLPSLPQVSLKIKRAANDPNIDIGKLTQIAEADPPFCGYLMQISNSPIYRGAVDIQNVNTAIGRLGLQNTCNIAMTYAIRAIFRKNKAATNKWLEYVWKNSTYTAAVSTVIAENISQNFDPDEALLAGLLQDIGCLPLIDKASHYPEMLEDTAGMYYLFDKYAASIGAAVLKNWRLQSKFINVVKNRDNWKYNEQNEVNLTDLVLLAKLHTYMGKKLVNPIPKITQTPSFIKMQFETELSAENSLKFIIEAKQRIAQTQRALGG